MDITLDASIDRQRSLWVATSARFPEIACEARTVDELREKFPDALDAASLPRDAKLTVRFYYDHGTRAAAVIAAAMTGREIESIATVSPIRDDIPF